MSMGVCAYVSVYMGVYIEDGGCKPASQRVSMQPVEVPRPGLFRQFRRSRRLVERELGSAKRQSRGGELVGWIGVSEPDR